MDGSTESGGSTLNLTGRSLEKAAHGSSAGHRLISRGLGEFANTFITLE